MNSRKYLYEIPYYLTWFVTHVRFENKLGNFDINKHAESFVIPILNEIFRNDFVRLEEIKLNYPAIDIGSRDNKISIQLTAEKGADKIRRTISSFIANGLYEDYKELYHIIIEENYKTRLSLKEINDFIDSEFVRHKKTRPKSFIFDPSKHVINFTKIMGIIKQELIYDLAGLQRVWSFLHSEYGEAKSLSYLGNQITVDYFNEEREIKIVDENLPFLEQLVQLFESEIFRTMDFIPHQILIRFHPFASNERVSVHNFDLKVSDDCFLKVFAPLGVTDVVNRTTTKVTNISSSLQNVADKLFGYSIHKIGIGNRYVSLYRQQKELCNCSYCKIQRLDFTAISDTYRVDNPNDSDLSHKLKQAYLNYKLENLKKATELIIEALDLAKDQQNQMAIFICYYNLTNLNSFLRFNRKYKPFYSKNEVLLKTASIELEKMKVDSVGTAYRPLFKWISESTFYYSVLEKIEKIVYSAQKTQKNSLSEGNSMNSIPRDLIYQYSQFEYFVQNNNIIFDEFSQNSNITRIFAEGLYSSMATIGDNSQISQFGDWMLQILIKHAKADDLTELFHFYNLKEIKYKQDHPYVKQDSTTDMIMRLFSNAKISIQAAEKYCENGSSFFFIQNRHIHTSLVLLAQCNFSEESLKRIIPLIPKAISERKLRVTTKYLEYFLVRKSEFIDSETYKQLWMAMFMNPELHWGNFSTFHILANGITRQNLTIQFSHGEFNRNIRFVQDFCEDCGRKHEQLDSLVHLYRVIDNENQKNEIIEILEEKLNSQSFDYDLFELIVVYDVLPFTQNLMQRLIPHCSEIMLLNKNNVTDCFPFLSLVNACFKFDFDLSDNMFDPLRGISPFSDWLMNFDHYDYTNFRSDWIYTLNTTYASNKMKVSKRLKNEIEKIISAEKSGLSIQELDKLEKKYIDIFVK